MYFKRKFLLIKVKNLTRATVRISREALIQLHSLDDVTDTIRPIGLLFELTATDEFSFSRRH